MIFSSRAEINHFTYSRGAKSLIEKSFLLQIQRFSLYKQIELFQGTQELIRSRIGKEEAEKFFQGAHYVVALGSNDFINNYLMPVYSDSWTYNDQTFMDYLIGTLGEQLKVYLLIHSNTIIFFLKRYKRVLSGIFLLIHFLLSSEIHWKS